MAERELILSMSGVTKVYGSGERAVTALADVSLRAHAGAGIAAPPPLAGPPPQADARQRSAVRDRHHDEERGQPRLHPPRKGGLRVPELQPARGAHGSGERTP